MNEAVKIALECMQAIAANQLDIGKVDKYAQIVAAMQRLEEFKHEQGRFL